ncbi:hypothetical protein V6N11_071114 [Hibiscus sabdariffa]|uniref:Secreted protein n=1 Tax=Hibiscus sabdariffa TaxID=183260 RepID=A0ABR2TZ48_9ROSI
MHHLECCRFDLSCVIVAVVVLSPMGSNIQTPLSHFPCRTPSPPLVPLCRRHSRPLPPRVGSENPSRFGDGSSLRVHHLECRRFDLSCVVVAAVVLSPMGSNIRKPLSHCPCRTTSPPLVPLCRRCSWPPPPRGGSENPSRFGDG